MDITVEKAIQMLQKATEMLQAQRLEIQSMRRNNVRMLQQLKAAQSNLGSMRAQDSRLDEVIAWLEFDLAMQNAVNSVRAKTSGE